MKTYIITQSTRDLFPRCLAPGHTLRDTSRVMPDGTFELDLSDDVAERIEQRRHPGESDDDVLFRVLTLAGLGLIN